MIVGEKDGIQESLHQFVGKCMSIILSLPVQMVISPPAIAGYTHTFEIWNNYTYFSYTMDDPGKVSLVNLKKMHIKCKIE